jgi:hypothetical protein
MTHLRALLESRPMLTRIPDQSMLDATSAAETGGRHVQATRARDRAYAMIYIPTSGQTVTLQPGVLSGERLRAWWYDVRTGTATLIGEMAATEATRFTSPASGPDWVLVLDEATRVFPAPGSMR